MQRNELSWDLSLPWRPRHYTLNSEPTAQERNVSKPDYQIVIPSYQRPEGLVKMTLATLTRYEAPMDRVTVFVADEEEEKVYAKTLADNNLSVNLVVGVKGLCPQRVFIDAYFPKGTPLICIDDDLSDLLQKDDVKFTPMSMTFDDMVALGFSLCDENGAKLWGLYPVANGMFMKDWTVVGLRFIYGVFCGTYAGYQCIGEGEEDVGGTAEDWERTLRSFNRYGKVVRIEWLAVKSKMYAKGGIQAFMGGKEQRLKENKTRIQTVADKYPELCSTYTKAGDILNIRLKNIVEQKIPREQP